MSIHLTPEFQAQAERLSQEHGPILGVQQASLGAQRFARFVQAHAAVQAMTLVAVMSVTTAPIAGYTDEALAALRGDADDLEQAAREFAGVMRALAGQWQQQREEASS